MHRSVDAWHSYHLVIITQFLSQVPRSILLSPYWLRLICFSPQPNCPRLLVGPVGVSFPTLMWKTPRDRQCWVWLSGIKCWTWPTTSSSAGPTSTRRTRRGWRCCIRLVGSSVINEVTVTVLFRPVSAQKNNFMVCSEQLSSMKYCLLSCIRPKVFYHQQGFMYCTISQCPDDANNTSINLMNNIRPKVFYHQQGFMYCTISQCPDDANNTSINFVNEIAARISSYKKCQIEIFVNMINPNKKSNLHWYCSKVSFWRLAH